MKKKRIPEPSVIKEGVRRILLKMKWTTFFLLLGSLALSASTYSQKAKIDLEIENSSVEQVLQEIEKSSEFIFIYDAELIRQTPRRSVSIKRKGIELVLNELFEGTHVSYLIDDRQVFLFNKEEKPDLKALEEKAAQSQRQRKVIAGLVTDSEKLPLPGVTIVVKGTTFGTITYPDGTFQMSIPAESKTLLFTFVGMKPVEVEIGSRLHFNVTMIDEAVGVDEVVVVGFGTQRKVSLVGAQSSVKAEELQVPSANLTNTLTGRLAGVVGVQRTGEPGFDDSDIWIRGISTFSQSLSRPLYLVDGVPREMSNVDPEDIESFTVLKDASATAVYGVRGANGVIIIKTKTGSAGKPKFSFRYYEGLTKFTRLPEFADGPTYMRMSNEALTNRGAAPIYSDEEIQLTADGADPYQYPNVDWMGVLFNEFGHQRRANLNVTGGSESATFYVGASYFDEVGLYKQDDLTDYNNQVGFKRYNLTTNLSIKASGTTKIDLGVQGYLANANYPGSGQATIFENAFFVTPVIHPVKYENGEIADQRAGGLVNPYGHLAATGYANQWRNQLFLNLRATQDLPFILDGLSASVMFSFDVYNYTSMRRTKRPDTYLAIGRDEAGDMLYEETYRGERFLSFSRNSTGERTIYLEGALNYEKQFKKHAVKGMLLFNKSDLLNSQAGDFITSLPYRYLGLSGRGTYGYDDRYFVELNFGYNGSENFVPRKRFGFFPSIGLGWVVSEESFFEPASRFIQMAKFRFSYGTVGNSQISGRRFAYLSTIGSTTGYSYGKDRNNNYGGYDIGEYGVDVTWETATKTNIGIDLHTLKNKLNLQIDYFKERREGIFLNRAAVPAYVGLQRSPYGNLGIIENSGFDGSMTFSKRINDFFFQAMGNFAFNRNEVIENDQPKPTYPWLDQRGRKVGQRFGLKALGLFETNEEIANGPLHTGMVQPGDIKFQDINGDGMIDDFDRIPIGYGTVPEIVYGFGLTVGYKNLSLSTLFQGVGNVDIYMNGEGVMPFSVSMSRGNLLSNIEDRWTIENPSQHVFYPRLSDGSPNSNYVTSSWWVKNGRYLRLKNIQLTYNLPKQFIRRIKFEDASIFLSGMNVLTMSPFKFWDVELGDGRGTRYPNIATYSLGLEVKF